MPWGKTFDVEHAVDRATGVFWAKGYESSSLSDLLSATGINKGSFYNAFGSKKALFLRALLKYDREQRRSILSGLEALNDPIAAISKLFDGLIEQCSLDQEHKGCFLINTALDLPNHDPDVQQVVKSGLSDLEAFFERQIVLGIHKKSIPEELDTHVTAKALLALVVGLRLLSRGAFDTDGLRAIRTQALSLIRVH